MTDTTTINDNTPRAIPAIEKNEIKEIKELPLLAREYRDPINKLSG
jgi:hypothetical protein